MLNLFLDYFGLHLRVESVHQSKSLETRSNTKNIDKFRKLKLRENVPKAIISLEKMLK